jgi:hypothetical protein
LVGIIGPHHSAGLLLPLLRYPLNKQEIFHEDDVSSGKENSVADPEASFLTSGYGNSFFPDPGSHP